MPGLLIFGTVTDISIRPHCHLHVAIFSTFLVCVHEALVETTETTACTFVVIFLSNKAAQAKY